MGHDRRWDENRKKPSNQKAFEKGFWSEKEVKKTYLNKAKQYVWNKDYFERTLLPLFALKEDSTVVDVGCGLGFFTEMLSVHVPKGKVLGIDLDSKLIEEAQKRVDTLRDREVLEFRTGDASNLPLPNGFAERTICQTLLMHLSDPANAIN